MPNTTVNTMDIMKGTDGLLFVEFNGTNIPLLEVENFSVTMNVTAVDKQFVGSVVVKSIPTGVSFALTFTECVVRDEPIINVILNALNQGNFPVFNFQGKLQKSDGQEQRYAFNDAVPNGTFSLMNVTPGETISREMNFSLNEVPDIISSISSTYL